jgi:hypothetical protein
MIAAIGFSFFSAGSTSTAKFSKAVAPRRYNESFGANITGQGIVSLSSGTVNSAEPISQRTCRPSAKTNSLVCNGSSSISCNRSSGTKLYIAPLSTQKSSSRNSSGFDAFETFTLTLNRSLLVPFYIILSAKADFIPEFFCQPICSLTSFFPIPASETPGISRGFFFRHFLLLHKPARAAAFDHYAFACIIFQHGVAFDSVLLIEVNLAKQSNRFNIIDKGPAIQIPSNCTLRNVKRQGGMSSTCSGSVLTIIVDTEINFWFPVTFLHFPDSVFGIKFDKYLNNLYPICPQQRKFVSE